MDQYDPSLINLASPSRPSNGNGQGATNTASSATRRSKRKKTGSSSNRKRKGSKKRRRRSPSSDDEDDEDEEDEEEDDEVEEFEEDEIDEDEDDESEDDGKSRRKGGRSSKKGKRAKDKAVGKSSHAGGSGQNPSFDFPGFSEAGMAQAVAMLQAQANAPYSTFLNQSAPPIFGSPQPTSNVGGGSGSNQPPSPYRGGSQVANNDIARQIEAALHPIRIEIHGLRQRIEALEARPFNSQAEIDSLKRGISAVADKVSVDLGPSFTTPGPADEGGLPASANYFESQAHHDIPVHGSELDRILVGTGHKDAEGKEPSATPSRGGVGIDLKAKNKPRKPELSRAVRQTIFKMMGVTPGNAIGGAAFDDGTPSRGTKFGPEHTRAFHGYTANAQALLPDFTDEELVDPSTGEKLWRWDWTKTIRQSTHNAAFMAEIHNAIARAVEDPEEAAFPEVPTADWQHLDEAIESAYTNMRRERDSQSDPQKLAKRGRHRMLTKKRGIKEEKLKRRRKALEELRTGEGQDKLIERGVQIPVDQGPDEWELAMDINLMSSEEEGDQSDPAGTIDIWEPGVGMVPRNAGSSSTSAKGKSFVVSKPAWRSEQAKVFLAALDALRGQEKSAKRLVGPDKQGPPPVGTPEWMVKPGVRVPKK